MSNTFKHSRLSTVVRRSFVLPTSLINEAKKVAPAAIKDNLNRLVRTAFEEYVQAHQAMEFEQAMGEMAKDQALCRQSAAITREFEAANGDGL
ncbi:MAG: hypothetical protein HY547_01140 [Elusimicrobia bacterium]|nr:hypothetical protein [Elusimicrobiota bacterium]